MPLDISASAMVLQVWRPSHPIKTAYVQCLCSSLNNDAAYFSSQKCTLKERNPVWCTLCCEDKPADSGGIRVDALLQTAY